MSLIGRLLPQAQARVQKPEASVEAALRYKHSFDTLAEDSLSFGRDPMLKSKDGISLMLAGASGAVGREVLKVLDERNIPIRRLGLYASARSAGEEINVRIREGNTVTTDEYVIDELTADAFKGFDYAIFSIGSAASKQFVSAAQAASCIVIDNSSALRMEADVPLVVPPVNAHALANHDGIIANPNCTTAIAMTVLAPLHRVFGLKYVTGSTYQAVSGAGAEGLRQLDAEVRYMNSIGAAMGRSELPEDFKGGPFPHRIAFNVIPHVESFTKNGYTKEELKMGDEGAKILGHPSFKASITCVRVAVKRAHAIDLTAAFERPVSPEAARKVLNEAPGVIVVDIPGENIYPMPLSATGQNECQVGRIRTDLVLPNALKMFICGDQLLRGAALNAVEILEHLIRLKHR